MQLKNSRHKNRKLITDSIKVFTTNCADFLAANTNLELTTKKHLITQWDIRSALCKAKLIVSLGFDYLKLFSSHDDNL